MRDSLEGEVAPATDLLECRIAAAAQWIENSSSALLEALQDTKPSESERKALKSSFFNGDKVFSLERWTFWKDKFRYFAHANSSLELREEAIRAADRAVEIMDRAERNWPQSTPD